MVTESTAGSGQPFIGDEDSTVLDLFGVKLKVHNRRLAEVLTMDAGEALATDVRQLLDPTEVREARSAAAQAAPDVVMAPPTGREIADSSLRAEMRSRSDAIGQALGFEIGAAGLWESPTAISLITRVIEQPLSYAAASDYVGKITRVLEGQDTSDVTALLIVDSQQTADVFKVAIRQRRLHDTVRTISVENLETIRSLYGTGAIDHARALILLTPIANADVGELLSIIRSAGLGETASTPEF